MTPSDRYRNYLRAMGPATQGSGGDEKTYTAVRAAWGFGLSEGDAMTVLLEWNRSCSPPWSQRDLSSKVRSVFTRTKLQRGFLLEDDGDLEPSEVSPPRYPPRAEEWYVYARDYAREWAPDGDSAVLRWAASRGFTEEDFKMANCGPFFRRAWQDSAPEWAPAWDRDGYHVLVPLFDHQGRVMSVRGRWGRVGEPSPRKNILPLGYEVAGLVMTTMPGWRMLRREVQPPSLWIVEGEVDLLTITIALARRGRGEAALGVFNGSWSPKLTAAIPKDIEVVVAVHDDIAGRRYRADLQAALHGRVKSLKFYTPKPRVEPA